MEKIQQTRCDRLRHLPFEPEVQIRSNNGIMRLLKTGFAVSNPPGRRKTHLVNHVLCFQNKSLITYCRKKKLYKTYTKCTKTKQFLKHLHLPRNIHHFSACMPGWNLPKEIKLMICQSTLGMRTSHLAINWNMVRWKITCPQTNEKMATNKWRSPFTN